MIYVCRDCLKQKLQSLKAFIERVVQSPQMQKISGFRWPQRMVSGLPHCLSTFSHTVSEIIQLLLHFLGFLHLLLTGFRTMAHSQSPLTLLTPLPLSLIVTHASKMLILVKYNSAPLSTYKCTVPHTELIILTLKV